MNIQISSFMNATRADGNHSQASENDVLVLNGHTVSLVSHDSLSGDINVRMENARTEFIEALKRQFGPEIADLAMRRAAEHPLTLRNVISVVNIASMAHNVRTALSTKAMSLPAAVDVRAILNSVRFTAGGADAVAMRAQIEELTMLTESTFEKLVHKHSGKELGKALLAGEGAVYEAYEAHYEALSELSTKLREYVNFCREQEGKLFKDGVSTTDMTPLGELQERVDHALGTLTRTATALTEAAHRGDKTFAGSRLRALLSPTAANGTVSARALNPAQISLALGELFVDIDRVDSGSATRADVRVLRERISEAMTRILGGKTIGDVNRLALKQFAWQLADADVRLKQLDKELTKAEDARAGNVQLAQALQESETIRKVMNGETSVKYLVDMKSLGLADKMLDPLFAEKNLQGDLNTLGSGSMNTVSIGTFKDAETGKEAKAVIKMAAPADTSLVNMGMTNILFTHRSPEQAKSLQRNAGVKIASNFIKCGSAVTTATASSINGQLVIVQELAPGKGVRQLIDGRNTRAGKLSCGVRFHDLINGRINQRTQLTDAQKIRLYGQVLEQTNRLAMSDYLTGQLDRHDGNFMFDVEGDLTNGSLNFHVTIKGIDNDSSFPVSRIGLEKFKLTGNAILNMEQGVKRRGVSGFKKLDQNHPLVRRNPPAVTFNDDGSVTVDLSRMSADERGRFFDIFGINNMAKPSFVLRDTYEAMTAPGARERFEREMAGTVGPEELQATMARFDEMVAYLHTLANANPSRVIDAERLRTSLDVQVEVADGERGNWQIRSMDPNVKKFETSNLIVSKPYVRVVLNGGDFGVIDMALERQLAAAQNGQPVVAPQQPEPDVAPEQETVELPMPPRPPVRPQPVIMMPSANVPKAENVHPAITEATLANFERNKSALGKKFMELAQKATAFSDILSAFVKERVRNGENLPEVAAYAKLMDEVKALITAAPADPAAMLERMQTLMDKAKTLDLGPVKKFIETVRRFSPLAANLDELRHASGIKKVQQQLTLTEINNTLKNAGFEHLIGKFDRYRLIELGKALDGADNLFYVPTDVVERCIELLDDSLVIEKPRTQAMDALEQVFGSLEGRDMIVAALKERLPAGVTFTETELDNFFRSVKPGDYVTGMNELLVDVLDDAVGSGLVTEAGMLTDDRVKPVFTAFAELTATRLEGLVESGRIVLPGYTREAHLAKLVDRSFPRAGSIFKSTIKALLAKDPANAFQLVRKFARLPMLSNDIAQFLLNLDDPAERMGILDRMVTFGDSENVKFATALHSKWHAIQAAERVKGASLTLIETLKILLPFLAETIDGEAEQLNADPGRAYGSLIEDGAMTFASTHAGNNPTALVAYAQLYTMLVPLGKTPTEIAALINGGQFQPTTFDPSLFSVGTAPMEQGIDDVKTLFARDLQGMQPILRLTLPEAGPNGAPKVVVLNKYEKSLVGEMKGPARSEISDAFVDEIYRMCGGNNLQAMNVVMSLTQNCDTDSLATSICIHESKACLFTRHDISFNPATGDVIVNRTSDPNAPVIYSVTRVFHADGTQGVVSISTFKKNEKYNPAIPTASRAPAV